MTGNGLASHNGYDLAVSESVIEEAAAEIRAYAAATMLAFADTMGRIVLERFYGGDAEAWRRHSSKDVSLRRLAAKLGDEAHLSASSLYRCVAIRSVLVRLGSATRYATLSARH